MIVSCLEGRRMVRNKYFLQLLTDLATVILLSLTFSLCLGGNLNEMIPILFLFIEPFSILKIFGFRKLIQCIMAA